MSENDPYLFEQFKICFLENSDPCREATDYDWLHGAGKLWRDAIDAERSRHDLFAK